MSQSKCPVCGCKQFHVKDPEDSYDIYEFECQDGVIRFEGTLEADDCPKINEETETYCNACAWHDRFEKII